MAEHPQYVARLVTFGLDVSTPRFGFTIRTGSLHLLREEAASKIV